MKLGKKFLIIVGIILLVFAIYIARNVWIIKSLQRKVNQYEQMSNYYIKITSKDQSYTIRKNNEGEEVRVTQKQIYETFKKDDTYLTKLDVLSSDGTQKRLMSFCDGEKENSYIETEDSKIAFLDTDAMPKPAMVIDYFSNFSTVEFMKMVLFSKITSEEYQGKDCYKISSYPSPNILYSPEDENFDTYFEKENGLLLSSGLSEFEYQFNTVTDADLTAPDLTQYEVQNQK